MLPLRGDVGGEGEPFARGPLNLWRRTPHRTFDWNFWMSAAERSAPYCSPSKQPRPLSRYGKGTDRHVKSDGANGPIVR